MRDTSKGNEGAARLVRNSQESSVREAEKKSFKEGGNSLELMPEIDFLKKKKKSVSKNKTKW